MKPFLPLLCVVLLGCGGGDDGSATDGQVATLDAQIVTLDAWASDANPAAACAATFGSALPPGFSRVDGTVLAVVPPGHPTCAMPNGSHVVLQLQVGGAPYRMVVNIESTLAGDPQVRFANLAAPLPAPAWQDGFHPGVALDYPQDFNLHSGQAPFAPIAAADLSRQLLALIPVGSHVSVYGDGDGGASNHLIHRNGGGKDGAIVLGADGPAPRFLVFHFPNQTF
jgi:hypothetical protein